MPPVDRSEMAPGWKPQQQTLPMPELPTAPQPFPGAVATQPRRVPMSNPNTDFTQRQSEERLRLDREAANRAAVALGYTGAADRRAQEAADRKTEEAKLTGGVATTESENTAAFLTTQLSGHVRKINEVLKDMPEAIQPGWAETIGGYFGPRVRALVTPDETIANNKKLSDMRNTLNNRYGLAADVLLTLGTGAAYTEEQKKTYVEAYSPQVTDGPETLADKRNMMKEAVISARAKAGVAVGQIDRALLEIDKLYSMGGKEETEAAPSGGKKVLSTTEKTPPLPEGYAEAHIKALQAIPPGKLTLENYTTIRRQLGEQFGGYGAALTDQETPQAYVDYYNQTGQVGPIAPGSVPLTEQESHNAELSSSPLGTGVASFANAMTAGGVDLLVGQEGREKAELAQAENWKSDLAGEVLGSLAPMAGLSKGGGKLVSSLMPKLTPTARQKFMGDIAVNSIYGGVRGGAGADEGERFSGALKGTGAGAVGSVVGNAVTKGIAPLLSDTTTKALAQTKGIKTTTLQKLGLGRAEQSLSAVPGAHGAREKALKSFNHDNANRVLIRIGEKLPNNMEPGTEMAAFVHKKLSNAYNAIRPLIVGSADGQYDNAVTALKALNSKGSKKDKWAEIETALKAFKDPITGHYDGQGYKEASERLRYLTKAWMKAAETQGDVAAGDMGRVAEQARKQIQHLVQRQTPEVSTNLKALERAYAHNVRIEDAAERALATNEAIYSPGQYLTSIKKMEPNRGAAARGKALDEQYALAAQKILGPGNVGQLSVRDTTLTAAGLTGLGLANPVITGVMAAMAAGTYGPGVKRITQAILSGKRPSAADNEIVRRILSDATRHGITGE